MTHWYMLTIVGSDQPGIVAKITQPLFNANCQLGEASMIRLGNNFTIMLMVASPLKQSALKEILSPACDNFTLRLHLDEIDNKLHDHRIPEVLITVSGADRLGIVAQVTEVLSNAGLDILNLASDVVGTEKSPIYIMQIEGIALMGIESLENAVASLSSQNIDVSVKPIDTLIG